MYKNLNQSLMAGFTLIEALLAMTMSALLMGLLFEMYLASQRSFQLQRALLHVEENAKKAIEILSSEIRKAGMIGCPRLSADFPRIFYGPYSISFENKLIGTATEITIRYAEFPAAALTKNMHDLSSLTSDKSLHFAKQDILLIADCNKADLFQVENTALSSDVQHIFATAPLHHRYEKNAELARFVVNKFFIAQTNRVNQDGTPIYALFVEDRKHRKTELVEGIYQLSFLYSILRNGKMMESDRVEDGVHVIGVGIKIELAYFPIQKTWFMYVALR